MSEAFDTPTPTPTNTPPPTNTPTPTPTSTPPGICEPNSTYTPTPTPTPTNTYGPNTCCISQYGCYMAADTDPNDCTEEEGDIAVPGASCDGGTGLCVSLTATPTVTQTFTETPTPTATPTATFTPGPNDCCSRHLPVACAVPVYGQCPRGYDVVYNAACREDGVCSSTPLPTSTPTPTRTVTPTATTYITPTPTLRAQACGDVQTSTITGLNPTSLWPLQEETGTLVLDYEDSSPGTYTGTYTLTGAGIELTGSGYITTTTQHLTTDSYTLLVCVRGSTGTIASLEPVSSSSTSSLGLIEVSPAGTVWWGLDFGGTKQVVPQLLPDWSAESIATVSDWQDHVIVVSVGSAGQKAYLDGKLLATRTRKGTPGLGWKLRVGNGMISAWPAVTATGYSGHIDLVAYWNSQLSDAQVQTIE